jgi:aryl-alcohol dehydrogenase-like predicted oxidoreductase
MQSNLIPPLTQPVARLVQGTTMLPLLSEAECFELLDAAVAHGYTTFDTAHVHGQGVAERVFGRWLVSRGLREKIVILGKGGHHNADRARVTPYDITADLHDSLVRMQVEQIDLYLLHRDDLRVPVGPLIEVLNEHQRAGKIVGFGASNWSHQRIDEANTYAAERGLQPFMASSPNFSLTEQRELPWPGCVSISGEAGSAARAWYAAASMPLFTWSSLAGGFLSGRYTRANAATLTSDVDLHTLRCYGSNANFDRLERANELAAGKGVTLPQLALAYVLSQPLDCYALVGCRSAAEFRENLEASNLRLTTAEQTWLETGE